MMERLGSLVSLAVLLLIACTGCGGKNLEPTTFSVSCDPAAGVFQTSDGDKDDIRSRVHSTILTQRGPLESCMKGLYEHDGTRETHINLGIQAQQTSRGVSRTIYTRSEAFEECIAKASEPLDQLLLELLGPVTQQRPVEESEVWCRVELAHSPEK